MPARRPAHIPDFRQTDYFQIWNNVFLFAAFIHLLARIKVRPSASSSNQLPCRQVIRRVFMRIGSPLILSITERKKMAINQLAAALVLTVLSGSVLAAPSSPSVVTSKTRAQVVAELIQARANGELNVSDSDYPYQPKFVSTKTRAQVLAELAQARARGEMNVGDSDYPYQPAFVSTKSRAQVQAELAEYNKNPDPQGLYHGY